MIDPAPPRRARPMPAPGPETDEPAGLSACGRLARRSDPDRYLAALMAGADRRESVFALVAFAAEVAKTREVVSEAMLGHIRLQWWRDALAEIANGATPRAHEVVAPLAQAIRTHGLPPAPFEKFVDAREAELEADAPFATMAALEAYARDTAGSLLALTAQAEGASPALAARWADTVGVAWGLVGLVRATPFLAAQRRTALPTDRLAAVGLTAGSLAEGLHVSPGAAEAVRTVCRDIAVRARDLAAQRPKDRGTPATAAHAVLLKGHLHRLARADYDPADGRVQAPPPWRPLTLTLARLTGRI